MERNRAAIITKQNGEEEEEGEGAILLTGVSPGKVDSSPPCDVVETVVMYHDKEATVSTLEEANVEISEEK